MALQFCTISPRKSLCFAVVAEQRVTVEGAERHTAGRPDRLLIGADLPGVGYMLNFFRWEPDEDLASTAGRAVDHVGFEVKNIEEFCGQLDAKGIKLTAPYRRAPELNNIAIAVNTDPWGTSIELAEGLRPLF